MDATDIAEIRKTISGKDRKADIADMQKKVIPKIKELIKKEPEVISSVEKTKDGWIIQCEVLEKKSIPETYDLLKVFEFRLDNSAKIIGFSQIKKIRRIDTY